MTQSTPLVIHIATPRVHSFLTTLDPKFGELDYDTHLHERYLVMDWPSNGQYVIMNEEQLERVFDTETAREAWFFKAAIMEERQ